MAPRALLLAAVAIGLAVLALAAVTPVPAEDGVSYFWLAQSLAAGDVAGALGSVFPPGYPAVLAPWLALGLAPEHAAALVGAGCLGLTVWPLARIAEHVAPGAAPAAVVLWGSSPLLLRVAAEGYSEPPFLLLAAWATWAGLQQRWARLGLLAGLAFTIRPEGLALAGAFVLAAPRTAWRALLPAAAVVLGLALVRLATGLGFDPLPLFAFHAGRDDLGAERGAVLANLLRVPGPWCEGLGLAGVLAVLAPWRGRRGAGPLRWQIALQLLAVVTFVVRRRFFLSCAVPVTVLAAVAALRLAPRWRTVLLGLAVPVGLVLAYRGRIDADRSVERDVGQWLAAQRAPGDAVFSEFARIAWYAGVAPGLPRRWTTAQLADRVAATRPRFVVADRDHGPGLAAALPDHVELALPPASAAAAARRGIAVFVRR